MEASTGGGKLQEIQTETRTDRPASHVFEVDGAQYAYDLNTQQLLAVEPELAALLRGEKTCSVEARAALDRARAEGLFSSHRPLLVPPVPEAAEEVDRNLRHLVLTVTEACNLRCAYCLHGAGLPAVRSHGRGMMSRATALAAIDYYLVRRDPDHRSVISFYGGEPLLNRPVMEAVVAAARAHPQGGDAMFAVDTNGVLLDDETVSWIVREKVHLQVSLDGPAEVHDRHRRDAKGQPTFARVMAGLDRLLERDPTASARLSFVATLAPDADLDAVLRFYGRFPPYEKRGIRAEPAVRVNRADLSGVDWPGKRTGYGRLDARIEELGREYLGAVKADRRAELGAAHRALFEPDLISLHHRSRARWGKTFTPGGNCRPGRRKLHVTVDGRLQPCERTGETLELGDLTTGIRPGAVQAIQTGFHDAVVEGCWDCWSLRLCPMCFATWARTSPPGSGPGAPPAAVCRGIRRRNEQLLQMLAALLDGAPGQRKFLEGWELD